MALSKQCLLASPYGGGQGVFEERMEGGSGLKHLSDVEVFIEERMEGGSRLKHLCYVEVLAHPPDPLTNASYVRELVGGLSSSLSPSSSLGGLAAEAEWMEKCDSHSPQNLSWGGHPLPPGSVPAA